VSSLIVQIIRFVDNVNLIIEVIPMAHCALIWMNTLDLRGVKKYLALIVLVVKMDMQFLNLLMSIDNVNKS